MKRPPVLRIALYVMVVVLSLIAAGMILILPEDSKVVDLVYGKF